MRDNKEREKWGEGTREGETIKKVRNVHRCATFLERVDAVVVVVVVVVVSQNVWELDQMFFAIKETSS